MSRRKPVLSLAAAIHRATPAAALPSPAAAAATPGSGAAGAKSAASVTGSAAGSASASPSSSTGGRKRKHRPAALISAFHVLQRERESLQQRRGSLTPAAYAAQQSALDARLAELGGLQAYQSLSIAGHSNSRYAAFNTSHWIIDVLASYQQYAQLRVFAKRKAASGSSALSSSDASGSASAAGSGAVDRRLIRRQKEREKKRARKRQKKAEEAAAAAQATTNASQGVKSKKGNKVATAAASTAQQQDSEEEDEDAAENSDGEENEDAGDDDGEGAEEHSGDGGAGHSFAASSSASSPSAPLFSSSRRVRLLDVGSITNHYAAYASLIDCTAIDLQPQHASVQQRDFFDLDYQHELRDFYDVVVLSLVLNFVGDRFRRGEMIQRSVKMLRDDGAGRLFIVLPAACLNNSRWMDHRSFVDRCMAPLGLQLGQYKYTTKLACYEFIRRAPTEEERDEEAEREAEKARLRAAQQRGGDDKEETEAAAEDDDAGEEVDTVAAALAAKKKQQKQPAAAAGRLKKRKGFQPAGIVLEGETRNNFSIAWRAD